MPSSRAFSPAIPFESMWPLTVIANDGKIFTDTFPAVPLPLSVKESGLVSHDDVDGARLRLHIAPSIFGFAAPWCFGMTVPVMPSVDAPLRAYAQSRLNSHWVRTRHAYVAYAMRAEPRMLLMSASNSDVRLSTGSTAHMWSSAPSKSASVSMFFSLEGKARRGALLFFFLAVGAHLSKEKKWEEGKKTMSGVFGVFCVVDGGWYVRRADMLVTDGALVVAGTRVGSVCSVDAAKRIFKGASVPLCSANPVPDAVFGEGRFVDTGGVPFEERFVSGGSGGRRARVCISDKHHVFGAETPRYPLRAPVPRDCAFVFGRMPPDMLLAVASTSPVGVEGVCQAVLDFLRAERFDKVDGERSRHAELHRLYATGYELQLDRAASPAAPATVYPEEDGMRPAAGDALGPAVGGKYASESARVLAAMVRNSLLVDNIAETGKGGCAVDREMLLCDAGLKWTSIVAQTLFPLSARAASTVGCAPSFARWRAAVEAM
jgi:hypothetical protein